MVFFFGASMKVLWHFNTAFQPFKRIKDLAKKRKHANKYAKGNQRK